MRSRVGGRGFDAVRLLPELRSFHLELAAHLPEILFVFQDLKYDAPTGDLPQNVQRLSTWQTLQLLRSADVRTLEMWEPLWVRCLPRHVLYTLFWCMPAGSHGWRRVGSYAMENNDPRSLLLGPRRAFVGGAAVTWVFRIFVGCYIRLVYDKIAFAGESAREVYLSLPGVRGVTTVIHRDLPGRLAPPEGRAGASQVCVFVGRLERRKGIVTLMQAWPAVEARLPAATIILVGDGPYEPEVVEWTKANPLQRSALGGLDHQDAVETMSHATVLVLPSEREGRWREQIGLPIREALQAGLTVVATTETGLAEWLRLRGHQVVQPESPWALADALVSALRSPLDPAVVTNALPELDGEHEASLWLHALGARR